MSPAFGAEPVATSAPDFVTAIADVRGIVTCAEADAVGAAPRGGVPVTVAVLLTTPASVFAWVTG